MNLYDGVGIVLLMETSLVLTLWVVLVKLSKFSELTKNILHRVNPVIFEKKQSYHYGRPFFNDNKSSDQKEAQKSCDIFRFRRQGQK